MLKKCADYFVFRFIYDIIVSKFNLNGAYNVKISIMGGLVMTKRKKRLFIKLILGFIALIVVMGIIFSVWWFNSAWQPTPELALQEHRDHGFGIDFDPYNYTIETHFLTVNFQESATMIFWSETQRLMLIGFPRCRWRQRYSAQVFTIVDLDDDFWVNSLSIERADPFAWQGRNTTVIEVLSLSTRQAYVNGIPAETIRFEIITPNGVTHQVQFWHKELQGRNAQFTIEYRDRVIAD